MNLAEELSLLWRLLSLSSLANAPFAKTFRLDGNAHIFLRGGKVTLWEHGSEVLISGRYRGLGKREPQ